MTSLRNSVARLSAALRPRTRRTYFPVRCRAFLEPLEERTLLSSPGDLDPTFGTAGRVVTNFGGDTQVNAAVLQPDGKLVVVGNTTSTAGKTQWALARYNPDGSPDTSFGPASTGRIVQEIDTGPFPLDVAVGVGLQTDAQGHFKLVVAGQTLTHPSQAPELVLARYNLDGTLDTAGFDPDGSLDPEHHRPGFVTAALAVATGVDAFAVATNGQLLVGGTLRGTAGPSDAGRPYVARFNADGTIDPTFGANQPGQAGIAFPQFGLNADNNLNQLAVDDTGRVVVIGASLGGSSAISTFGMVRLTASGNPDPTFGRNSLAQTSFEPEGLALQTVNGKSYPVAVGAHGPVIGSPGTDTSFAVTRFTDAGVLDSSFNGGRTQLIDFTSVGGGNSKSSDFATAVAAKPDGPIVVAGITGVQFALARLNADGSPDASFGNNGRVETRFNTLVPNEHSDRATAVLVQPDAKVVVAGTVYGQSGVFGVARFLGGTPQSGFPFGGHSTLSGTVFHDINGNGVDDGPTQQEGGLANWKVFLDLHHDGQLHPDDPSTVTGPDGTYQFKDLSAGTYTVVEVPPAGWLPTPHFTPSNPASLASVRGYKGFAIADLDGSGRNAVAVAEISQVHVFTPQPDGSYMQSSVISSDAGLAGIAAGPLVNGSGTSKPDLATVNSNLGTVEVYPNRGDGTFLPFVRSHVGPVGSVTVVPGVLGFGSVPTTELVVANPEFDTIDILTPDLSAYPHTPGQFSPRDEVHLPGHIHPEAVVLGAFTGNPVPDIAVASPDFETVTILYNDGHGGFDGRGTSILTDSGPAALAVGDFNGDGNLDLAVACRDANVVDILLGDGHGNFAPSVSYPVGAGPMSLVAGDFNGDGITDLAVANEGDSSATLLLGVGDGTFVPVPLPLLSPVNPIQIASADLTGHGGGDLAVLNQGTDVGGKGFVTILARGGGRAQQVVVGDNAAVTGVDFGNLVGNGGDLRGTVFRDPDGDGVRQAYEARVANQPVFFDLNGNGQFDPGIDPQTQTDAQGQYFFGNVPAGDAAVVVAAAQGFLGTSAPVHIKARVATTLDIGLAHGTGAIDGTVFNDPSGTGQRGPGAPGRALFLDLNGDGVRQANEPAAVTDATGAYHLGGLPPGPYTVVEEQAPGWVATVPADVTFTFTRAQPNGGPGVVAADLTGDGYPDLVVGQNVTPYLNDHTVPGSFPAPLGFALPGTMAPSLVVADFNGDGFPDLAAPDVQFTLVPPGPNEQPPRLEKTPASSIAVRFNDPGAPGVNYRSPVSIPAGTDLKALVTADFNGDGLLDLAVTADGPHGSVAVLLNDPRDPGTFLPAVTFDAGFTAAGSPTSLAVADFNGDGLPDLAVVNAQDAIVNVLLNDPNHPGHFLPAVSFPGATKGQCVLAADLNRDGRPDLVVASLLSGDIVVLLNSSRTAGPLSFAGPADYGSLSPLLNQKSDTRLTDFGLVRAVDLNRDGFLDLAVSGLVGFGVLLNTPTNPGTFRATGFVDAGSALPSLAFADFNGDGAADVALTGSSGSTGIAPTNSMQPLDVRDVFAVGIRTVMRAATVTAANPTASGIDFGNHPLPDSNGDGIPDAVEALGPPDAAGGQQPNVASLPNRMDGTYVTFVSPPGTHLVNVEAVPNPSLTGVLAGGIFPVGAFNFTVTGLAPGGSTTVTLILHDEAAPDPSRTHYFIFGHEQPVDMPHWFDFTFNGTTGAEIQGDRIVLHFVDGQRGDQDQVPGQISDPGGLALVPLTDPQAQYVAALYRTVLGRYADPTGLSAWVALLAGGATRAQVAQGIWESVEHRGQQVDGFYATYLHRAADPDGRAFWVQAFLGGASETDVAVGFLTSDEYHLNHPDTASFVHALYGDIFGRAPDPVGLAAWPPLVESPNGPTEVARGILTSVEEDLRLVDAYFTAYLHRPADSSGQQAWLPLLQSGAIAPAGVAEGVLASDEFFALVFVHR
jgi:uncharacterized delta-60 repeat protein